MNVRAGLSILKSRSRRRHAVRHWPLPPSRVERGDNAEKELNPCFVSRNTARYRCLAAKEATQVTNTACRQTFTRLQLLLFPGLGRFDVARGHSRCFLLPSTVPFQPLKSIAPRREADTSRGHVSRRGTAHTVSRARARAIKLGTRPCRTTLLHLPLPPAVCVIGHLLLPAATRLVPAFESELIQAYPEGGGR